MLKGVSPLLSPDLLKVLCEMGHGDTIVFADAHFPACSLGPRVLRADGIGIPALLRGILPLFELDAYAEHPFLMMEPVPGDRLDDAYAAECSAALDGRVPGLVERFAFYGIAERASAIVATGELRKYGNVILQKGVIPPPRE